MRSSLIAILLLLALLSSLVLKSQTYNYKRAEATVFFELNSNELTEDAEHKLNALFPFDSSYYPESIIISGHTDKTGDQAYNQKLSERRSLTVKNFITKNHIYNTEFIVNSSGETQPEFGCNDNLNRCVKVIMVLKEKEEPASLARCKELFPDEFATGESISEELVSISTYVALPETEDEEVLFEPSKNTFHQQVINNSSDSLKLTEINFYGNSDRYYKSAVPELEQLASFLNVNPHFDITISGHVNGRKKSSRILRKESEFNDIYDLSLARADAVKLFLIKHGVDAERIKTEGKGGEEMIFLKPMTQAESEANRRIEIAFHKLEN